MDCGNGVQSFGKRRRRDTENDGLLDELADKMVFDPNLGQKVIYFDTPLRKQIFVDPGIKVNRFTDPESNGEGRSFPGDETGGL